MDTTLAAIPVAAIAGALFLPIVMGIGVFITGISSGDNELMRPFKNWDITVTDTLFVSLYFLPFATLAGVPGYFVLRKLKRLNYRSCAVLGIAIGLIPGLLGPIFWTPITAILGAISASAAYLVLLLCSKGAPND